MDTQKDKKLPDIARTKDRCCGCGVCSAVCPVGAINMAPDEEGFLYPDIDRDKCFGCKKCESLCAFSHDRDNKPRVTQPDIYAVRLTDRDMLQKSSSGGAFSALALAWINSGGAVVCCRYDYTDHREKFVLLREASGLEGVRGSIYVQSFPDGIHQKALQYLKENNEHKLLFVGMGCQAAAFLRFAEKSGFRDRVTVCDVICHGSPSPMLWEEYAALMEDRLGGKISYVTFKDKTDGWKKPTPYIIVGEKKTEIRDYVRLFYSDCALRPSCHVCPYASVDRNTDITIGDFWGIDKVHPEFYDTMGNSLVIVRTQQGKELFDRAAAMLEVKESDRESCLQRKLLEPTPEPDQREQFWKDHKKGGIRLLLKKYGTEPRSLRLKKAIKKLIGRK